MIKYFFGFIFNFFNPAISLFAVVDNKSRINRYAKLNRCVKSFCSVVGPYSYVGPKTNLVYANIGKFCSIGQNCEIGLATHTLNYLSTSPLFTEKNRLFGQRWNKTEVVVHPYKNVNIGNDVWIGCNVLIMGGVSIGDGAVIGAGTVVTKDVPMYAIVAGVPAKIIKMRFPDEVLKKLKVFNWWNIPDSILKDNIECFQYDIVDSRQIDKIIKKLTK